MVHWSCFRKLWSQARSTTWHLCLLLHCNFIPKLNHGRHCRIHLIKVLVQNWILISCLQHELLAFYNYTLFWVCCMRVLHDDTKQEHDKVMFTSLPFHNMVTSAGKNVWPHNWGYPNAVPFTKYSGQLAVSTCWNSRPNVYTLYTVVNFCTEWRQAG